MLRGLSLLAPGRTDEWLFELKRLVDAIEKSDEDAAAELASKHVQRAAEIALTRLGEGEGLALASGERPGR
jgi:DNA-binding GntR family transcriptional regulator